MQKYNIALAITPSDTVDFIPVVPSSLGVADALFVGGAGVVALVLENGTVVNFTCVAGQILPVGTRRVNATNTTATLMIALWSR
jgi:hypothetical protein